jgi:predicted CXXCH cytochrome family protein
MGDLVAPAGAQETTVQDIAYVDSRVCAECHSEQYDRWQSSHHRHAMAVADSSSIRGDFDDVRLTHKGKTTRFFRKDGRYFVETEGPDGTPGDFEVRYTFGYQPLQQYLLAMADGRLQALDVAWDSANKRWFHLLPDLDPAPGDDLHWTAPFYTWNTTCAACHSTDLKKGYDPGQDSFTTTWAEVNVGCQACHGPGQAHVDWARSGAASQTGAGITAPLKGQDAAAEIQVCATCHSRRQALTENYRPGDALFDHFSPEVLRDDLYHPDGQILDEVYVYGSFLQSRMYQAGVRCSDCHEPHGGELKAAGNGVCTQCHGMAPPDRFTGLTAKTYDAPSHHRHQADSSGSLCVSCHMPAKTYMIVDPRRDHSLRVPRPDLSVKLGTPNACTQCHQDQTDIWAAEAVAAWTGGERRERHYGEVLQAARRGEPGARDDLLGLLADQSQPAIVRATGLSLLASYAGAQTLPALAAGLADTDPQARLSALRALEPYPLPQRWRAAAPLLNDPRRALRIETARLLAGVPREQMSENWRRAFDSAVAEFIAAQQINQERPEAHLNLGALHASLGDGAKAEAAYLKAIQIAPRFVPAMINLADLYRQQGRDQDGLAVLQNAVETAPNLAEAHFALGLAKVRQSAPREAVAALTRAAELAPDTPRYAYVLAIALNSNGRWLDALKVLREAHDRAPYDRDLLYALATINRDRKLTQAAITYARKLVALDPSDEQAQQLLRLLRQGP